MSERSSHGHGKPRPTPLRGQTRAEERSDRKVRRNWRARKLVLVLAAMPLVAIGVVGVAMANPLGQSGGSGAAACSTTTNSAAGTGTSAVNGANAANGRGGRHHRGTGTATATASSTGTTTTATTTATGTVTTASASTTTATGTATTTTCPSTSATATTTTTTTTSAAATPNPNCTIIVPANPLSAAGLMTPYQLTATDPAMGPCNESNVGAQSAFVEAAILSPDGQLTTYDPVVVDEGDQPFSPPANPNLPAGATVAIWFGFNGTNLTLQAAAGTNSLTQGNCINGAPGSIFTQVAYCNAPQFFTLANQEIANNVIQIPAIGTASDGQPCPTTRSFALVDQDQSDNVVTTYLVNGNGKIAQDNAAAMAAAGNNATTMSSSGNTGTPINNGSDNFLLDQFVDPALGCSNFTRPNESEDGNAVGGLALDELSAAAGQQAPIALVPLNDPMTLDNNGNADETKTNLFRQGVDQPLIGTAAGGDGNGTTYCQNFFQTAGGIQRVFNLDQQLFSTKAGPDPAEATNLFTFLAMRAQQSFTNLGCGPLLNENNPITLTLNGAGVTTAATFNANPGPFSTATATASAAAPTTTATTTTTGTATSTTTAATNGTGTATSTTTAAMNGNGTGNGTGTGTGTPTATMTASGTGTGTPTPTWTASFN